MSKSERKKNIKSKTNPIVERKKERKKRIHKERKKILWSQICLIKINTWFPYNINKVFFFLSTHVSQNRLIVKKIGRGRKKKEGKVEFHRHTPFFCIFILKKERKKKKSNKKIKTYPGVCIRPILLWFVFVLPKAKRKSGKGKRKKEKEKKKNKKRKKGKKEKKKIFFC